jgi:Spy/CpxP family protein refolding chaperone
MKNMKKLFLIAALLAGSVMFANAQLLTKSADQRVGHQMKALQKNLNLDAAQSEKINTILLARANKVDSLKANNTGDKKANRQTIKALMQSTEERVNAVLTADQQKTYVQLKETRKAKMQKRGDQTMDAPPTKG